MQEHKDESVTSCYHLISLSFHKDNLIGLKKSAQRFNGRTHRTFRAKLGDSFTNVVFTALHRAAAL